MNTAECLALVGPSGVGKSSLLRMIYGNYRCDSGSIRLREGDRWVDLGRAEGCRDQPRRHLCWGRVMTQKASSNHMAFLAVGAILVAVMAAPASTSSDVIRTYGWIGAGMAALVAVTLGLQAIRSAEARPSPWTSPLGRIARALRPRAFLVAWALIGLAVWMWGTPHLSIIYPPRQCVYAGLFGLHQMPPGAACPWWKWL